MTTTAVNMTMDDAYAREFYREWVAVLGPRTRSWRRWAFGFAAFGVTAGLVGWGGGVERLLLVAAVTLLYAAVMFGVLARRRSVWARGLRSHPWFGKDVRLEMRDGVLVQLDTLDPEPPVRACELVSTPNGYLARFDNADGGPPRESLYIQHRAVTPAMTREAFLALLNASDASDESSS